MPELPDLVVYMEHLDSRVAGKLLLRTKLHNPFVLRTAVPPLSAAERRRVVALRRIGKRIVIELEGELFLVLHLMIAGRLRWLERKDKPPGRITLASFEFENGTLVFTEAGTKRRASLHVVEGEPALQAMDPGGLEVLAGDDAEFAARVRKENHTPKRARLSPLALTGALDEAQVRRLFDATIHARAPAGRARC